MNQYTSIKYNHVYDINHKLAIDTACKSRKYSDIYYDTFAKLKEYKSRAYPKSLDV